MDEGRTKRRREPGWEAAAQRRKVTLMSALRKVRVVLKVSKYNIPLFLACCMAVHAGMLAHQADYIGMPVTLADFLILIQNLEAAQIAARKRTIGAAGARDEARDALFAAVEML